MKCNYKRALQDKDVIEDFIDFVYAECKKKYYEKSTGNLKKGFFQEFYDFIGNINQLKKDSGSENYLTLDITSEKTGSLYDENNHEPLIMNDAEDLLWCFAYYQGMFYEEPIKELDRILNEKNNTKKLK